jgi:hypothetical protein
MVLFPIPTEPTVDLVVVPIPVVPLASVVSVPVSFVNLVIMPSVPIKIDPAVDGLLIPPTPVLGVTVADV